jgi:hypothetical protein
MPIVVAVLGVVIIVMGVILFITPNEEKSIVIEDSISEEANRTEEMTQQEESVVEKTPNPTPDTSITGTTFTEDVSYLTPARTEHKMAVSLTVAGGVVTDASIVYDAGDGYSNPNQERFDTTYKTEVIGKPLSEISLSRVGGASLTSQAFNEAVAKIAAQQS